MTLFGKVNTNALADDTLEDLEQWQRAMKDWTPIRADRIYYYAGDRSYKEAITLALWGKQDIRTSFHVPGVVMKDTRRRADEVADRRVEMWQTIGVELGKALGLL